MACLLLYELYYSTNQLSSTMIVQGQRRSMSAPTGAPRRDSLVQEEFVKDADRILRRGDAMARDARVIVNLVVVPALARRTGASESHDTLLDSGVRPPPERNLAPTSKVLSPKKWIVLKPSDSRWRSAYVLSQPTGNTSNEIWPPIRNKHTRIKPQRIRRTSSPPRRLAWGLTHRSST